MRACAPRWQAGRLAWRGERRFWVGRERTVEVEEGSHIGRVVDDPESFGTTREAVTAAYRRWGEPVGFGGRAREEIFSEIFRSGWIRVRLSVRRAPSWIFQFARWDGRTREAVGAFMERARGALEIMEGVDSVVLTGIEDGFAARFRAAEGLPAVEAGGAGGQA